MKNLYFLFFPIILLVNSTFSSILVDLYEIEKYESIDFYKTNKIKNFAGNDYITRYFILIGGTTGNRYFLGCEQNYNWYFFRENAGLIFLSNSILFNPFFIGGFEISFFSPFNFTFSLLSGVHFTYKLNQNKTLIFPYIGYNLGLNFYDYYFIDFELDYLPFVQFLNLNFNFGLKFELFNNKFKIIENTKKIKLIETYKGFEIDPNIFPEFSILKEYYSINKLSFYFEIINFQNNFNLNYSLKQLLNLTKNFSIFLTHLPALIFDIFNLPLRRIIVVYNNISNDIILTPFGFYEFNMGIINFFVNFYLMWLPFGYGWLHEEWHIGVMKNRGITNYYNEIWDFKFSEFTSVSHIRDEDLFYLKLNYPMDMIRLHEAGNEANLDLSLSITKENFFNRKDYIWINYFAWLFNILNSCAYLYFNSNGDMDNDIDIMMMNEGTNINIRDFTGPDFTA